MPRKKTTYGGAFSTGIPQTPQNQPIPGRESEMEQMASGGYGFKLEDEQRLMRFLVLGTEGGGYYEDEVTLTKQNVAVLTRFIKQSPERFVPILMDVRRRKLALKQSPVIFALAVATTFQATRRAALDAVSDICQNASQLFEFYAALKDIGGDKSNRSLRRTLARWYEGKDARSIVYQAIKYRNRNGVSHADMIRIAHPHSADAQVNDVLAWVIDRATNTDEAALQRMTVLQREMAKSRRGQAHAQAERALRDNEQLFAFEGLQAAQNAKEAAILIKRYNLPREAVPTQFLNDRDVWAALAENMPYEALVRNLNKMTAVGLIDPFRRDEWLKRLTNKELIVKSRIHPLRLLIAAKQYGVGHGDKGSLTWTPVQSVMAGLDEAFAIAMTHNIEPIQENVVVAIDVSGSMRWASVSGIDNLLSAEAAAVTAAIYARANPHTVVIGVDTRIHDLPISSVTSIAEAFKIANSYGGGGTDLGEAFRYVNSKLPQADGVLMITDNESWRGREHTAQAKARKSGKPLRWVNVATSANRASVVDPNDRDSLSLCGFSADVMTISNLFFSHQI